MWCTKVIAFWNPKSKDVGEGKTEKHDHNNIHGMTIKKLGYCKEAQSEERRFSVLIVDIYIGTAVKAAPALMCSEGISNISL